MVLRADIPWRLVVASAGVEFTVLLAWHSARHGGRAMVVVGIVLGNR